MVKSGYADAAFNGPARGWKTNLAQIPCHLLVATNHHWRARLFCVESFMDVAVEAEAS